MDGRRQEARARFPFHILANPIPIIQHPCQEHRDHIQIPHAVRGRSNPVRVRPILNPAFQRSLANNRLSWLNNCSSQPQPQRQQQQPQAKMDVYLLQRRAATVH